MSDSATITEPKPATPAVRGTIHRFLPLPVMQHHAQWFEAGPVSFALEMRVLDDGNGNPGECSISIHVFNPEKDREMVRFDCFDRFPHYHYIFNDLQENVVWGYDPDANGPMVDWSFDAIRNRLASFLRRAGENGYADQVDQEGLDTSAIDWLRQAIDDWVPSLPSKEAMAEAREWYLQWKKVHPQFNTATGQKFL